MSAAVSMPVQIGNRTVTLNFQFSTIRYFEEATGQRLHHAFPFLNIPEGDDPAAAQAARAAAADDVPWGTWAALFWASLQRGLKMTREAADDLIDEAGFEQVVMWCMAGLVAHLTGNPALADSILSAGDAPAGEPPKAGKKKAKAEG